MMKQSQEEFKRRAKWERKKVFINLDADYDTALERIREELYGTTNNESMFCGGNCFRAIRGQLGRFS